MGTVLTFRDRLGTVRARVGIARNRYRVNPGLYCVGEPTPESPVLVTANYKLSFDSLRKELAGTDAWLLVADTRGINVWCAAGKGTFSAEETALQVQRSGLDRIVTHRRLIFPQLAAPGVAVHRLRKLCGFSGVFGPIRAADIPAFLAGDGQATEAMRAVTFSLGERLVLVPVEIALVWKVFFLVTLGIFLLSGIGPGFFSLDAALTRGAAATLGTVTAILAGALLTPTLLPWIPGRQFWLKGAQIGGLAGIALVSTLTPLTLPERAGLLLWVTVAASYMAMNFTGATPFTSLSGVEKEMRRGLPFQITGTALSLVLWLAAPFFR
ncbi:MAG: mercury methylation corrinoid protein HgcA [Desulfobulbaceae bacterium]